jgi:hypothetical protein
MRVGRIAVLVVCLATAGAGSLYLASVATGTPKATAAAKKPPKTTTTSVASSSTVAATTTTTAPVVDPVLLAAGDIASCASTGDEATAALLDARPAAIVATLGDNVYDSGSATEFAKCYDPSWGQSKARTKPAPGNHDYGTAGAAGYYGYFGATAGDPAKGYYSYEVGTWHVVALNSNCTIVSCSAGSAQEQWLRADLAAHPAACTLAYWHHPRYSSGTTHGSSTATQALYQALYDNNADVILSGHEHNYERFAPMNATGGLDAARGIRSFVVGTGGASHYPFGRPVTGSEIRNGDTFGVLSLTLKAGGYDWQFVPEAGKTFTDSGTGTCH